MSNKVSIQRLASGVPGLDELLGGGIPEFSFNLLAGTPGSGKTTMAHQIMFSLASPERRALFFTVLGEPPLKMLRYQQQFPFFDVSKINHSIKFVNLAADLLDGNFDRVLARIADEVRDYQPSLVFVDSFRSVAQSAQSMDGGAASLQHFVQQLGMQMTSWLATTFLIGEYLAPEAESSPVFTVADGIIWMSQQVHRDALVRKIQVVKMRGQAQGLGIHTFRISDSGVDIFPRAMLTATASRVSIDGGQRLSTGVLELDKMMGGGVPAGYSMLVVGPSGSGKSVLATQFLAEGVRNGEVGVIAAFEKSPNQLLSHQLNTLIESGKLGVINTRTLDLSIDEILHDLIVMIRHMGAKRVVIDSLSGFELALAPSFRDDFRESLYRMIAVLTAMGVTVLMTAELEDRYEMLRFSSYGNAFLADAIVMQRYVELEGQLKRVISVVKVRASDHSKDIRFFDITSDGISIGHPSTLYVGILTGRPVSSPAVSGI
ncbi:MULTISPECIES: ATPase domain-containing protein [unclassified Janthinobacterium]|uniref:ATPase domain-containing protein n=1 Tax=unclassified Janthinobacterium TaxID=2610881 RepID=UPI0016129397|nr:MULTISPECIES: ATPase domain-containing protein [unclassified Janthinobacterium]MBB5606970.1 circadian clock protein KaiC [Janthinobacterium sp. S3T4]MBB5612696.1 circadian clock protein KaiC [Janthinobacterium sp. S3M3]